MATFPAPSPEGWRDELEAMLVRLRDETLLQAMALLFVLGLALLSLRFVYNASQAGVLTLIALLLIGLCGWGTYRRRYLVAAWILVLGLCGLVLLGITWGGIDAAVWLLALPVGLAALTISAPAGLILAGLCTIILILTPQAGLSLSETMRVTTLVGIWGMLGMVWIALRCVSTSVRMAWSSYEQTQALQERILSITGGDLSGFRGELAVEARLAGNLTGLTTRHGWDQRGQGVQQTLSHGSAIYRQIGDPLGWRKEQHNIMPAFQRQSRFLDRRKHVAQGGRIIGE